MHRPTLVLVHGSWHSPAHFGPLILDLSSHGFRSIAVDLPSCQLPDTAPKTLADDTEAVRSAVTSELESGNNVVVIAHSYGGTPTNNALKGLDTASRSAAGHQTSVEAIIFLAAIPIPAGLSFLQARGGKPKPIHDLHTYGPEFAGVGSPGPMFYFYNEMEPEEAKKWSAQLKCQSWRAYEEETSYAAYVDIPSYYLHCTKDQAFPYEAQQGLVKAIKEAGGRIKVETIDSDHTPFIGKYMAQTSEFIRKVACGSV